MAESITQNHEDLLAKAASSSNKSVVRWLETALKVHNKQCVAQMLAEHPELVEDDEFPTALHIAAFYGHDLIAAQLLTESPDLADEVDLDDYGALHWAATNGHTKVVEMLLAMPNSLHTAQLLTASSDEDWTALHCAVSNGEEAIAEMMLALNPDLINSVTYDDESLLHLACLSNSRNKHFYEKLLELKPSALFDNSSESKTPFEVAVEEGNGCAVQVLQREFSFDEIVGAFMKCGRSYYRYRPIVEGQCESLVGLLTRDVVGVVFAYLGFDAAQQEEPCKEAACDENAGDRDFKHVRRQLRFFATP